jgi:hypothetical protein
MLIPFDASKRPTDRREALRRRTRRRAVVVVNNGWSTFGAQVLNLSPDGALVEMDAEIPVPEFFQLRYDGVKKAGRRVWTRRRQVGVAFE